MLCVTFSVAGTILTADILRIAAALDAFARDTACSYHEGLMSQEPSAEALKTAHAFNATQIDWREHTEADDWALAELLDAFAAQAVAAERAKPAASDLERARKIISWVDGCAGDVKLLDQNIAAQFAEARREERERVALIVAKWDARSERWDDMPMDAVRIRELMIHNITALPTTPDGT